MKYVYAVELYKQIKEEAAALMVQHYSELSVTGEDGLFDPDDTQYEWLCDKGMLSIVTVRADGKLVGYHASFLKTHMHRRSLLTAYTDTFFILPEHRRGMVGYKLFKYVTEVLKRRGVKWIYAGVRLSNDVGLVLERQGYKKFEQTYLKVI